MSTKGKKTNQKQTSNQPLKREESLKAIVIADTFSKEFRPITLETAKVFLFQLKKDTFTSCKCTYD
jgi:hypothetical protein